MKTNFSESLKQARKEAGLTQKQVAEALSMTENAIANYENGRRTPDIHTVARLCELYEVSADDLLGIGNVGKI